MGGVFTRKGTMKGENNMWWKKKRRSIMGRWRMKESQDESWSERGRGGEFVKPNQPWGERGEEEDYCTRQVLTSRQQRRDEDVWPWCRQLSANQGSSQWPTQTPKTQIRIHHFFSQLSLIHFVCMCVCMRVCVCYAGYFSVERTLLHGCCLMIFNFLGDHKGQQKGIRWQNPGAHHA